MRSTYSAENSLHHDTTKNNVQFSLGKYFMGLSHLWGGCSQVASVIRLIKAAGSGGVLRFSF